MAYIDTRPRVHSSIIVSEEWAARALGIRICVVGGDRKPHHGMPPTAVIHPPQGDRPFDEPVHEVWLWAHVSTDGAGHDAPHFDFISEAPIKKTTNMCRIMCPIKGQIIYCN